MSEVSIHGVILCDEIRQEANGKYIILGVYSGGVAVQAVPATLALCLYIIAKFDVQGEQDLIVELISGGTTARVDVGIDITAPELLMHIPMPKMPIALTNTDDIVVRVGLGQDSDLSEAARFSVQVNPEIWSMYPSAPQLLDEQSPSVAQDSSSQP